MGRVIVMLVLLLLAASGCAQPRTAGLPRAAVEPRAAAPVAQGPIVPASAAIEAEDPFAPQPLDVPLDVPLAVPLDVPLDAPVAEGLAQLIGEALANNPRLIRLEREIDAAWARVPQLRAWPDPMVAGNVFGLPMRMGDGRLKGSLMVSQTIPWLNRLDAASRQAARQAMALEYQWQAERLRTEAEVNVAYVRLYVLERELEVNRASQELLESLLDAAAGRVEAALATQGDVLRAALEVARLEEQLLSLRQQRIAAEAALNELLDRPAHRPIQVAERLALPDEPLPMETLQELAAQFQPQIAAAAVRTQATAWGIEAAALERRPDVTLSIEQMFMAMDEMPGGRQANPWQVGVGVNVPVWRRRYEAMVSEARSQHSAAHAELAETVRRFEVRVREGAEQVRTAARIVELYAESILPQARRTLEADLDAYAQGQVEFDRVVTDFRDLLALELAHHRAVGELAIAYARLESDVGVPLAGP